MTRERGGGKKLESAPLVYIFRHFPSPMSSSPSPKKVKSDDTQSICSCIPVQWTDVWNFLALQDDINADIIRILKTTGEIPCLVCRRRMRDFHNEMGTTFYDWTDILFKHWSLTEGQQVMARVLVVACAGKGLIFKGKYISDLQDAYHDELMAPNRNDDDITGMVAYGARAARVACSLDIRIPSGTTRDAVVGLLMGPDRNLPEESASEEEEEDDEIEA